MFSGAMMRGTCRKGGMNVPQEVPAMSVDIRHFTSHAWWHPPMVLVNRKSEPATNQGDMVGDVRHDVFSRVKI